MQTQSKIAEYIFSKKKNLSLSELTILRFPSLIFSIFDVFFRIKKSCGIVFWWTIHKKLKVLNCSCENSSLDNCKNICLNHCNLSYLCTWIIDWQKLFFYLFGLQTIAISKLWQLYVTLSLFNGTSICYYFHIVKKVVIYRTDLFLKTFKSVPDLMGGLLG